MDQEQAEIHARLAGCERQVAGQAEIRARLARVERQLAELLAQRASVETGALPIGMVRREAAAEFLGLRPSTLHKWAHRGIGPPFKIFRGKAFYCREALSAWAAANVTSREGGRRPAAEAAGAPLLAGLE
jgi:hypothetical protein